MNTNKLGKYALSSAIFAAAFIASATDYTVKQSGDWSDGATWEGGSAPTTSASDNVIFGAGGLNSTISADTTVGSLDVSAGDTVISIGEGKTLTLSSFVLGSGKTFTSDGDGTLVLKGAITGANASGVYNFNSKVDASKIDFVVTNFAGEINFYNGLNISGKGNSGRLVVGSNNAVVRFGRETAGYTGAKQDYTIGGILNCHTVKSFTIGSDANVSSSEGLMVRNMGVYGALTVSGVGGYTDYHSSKIGGTSTFYAGSEFTQVRSQPDQYKNIIEANLTLKRGVKKFAYGNDVSMQSGVKLTLETSNLITVNGAAQGDSTFYLQTMTVKEPGLISSRVYTKSNVTIELLADNDFGAFDFCGASILNLITNGNKVVIGGFTVSDTSESYLKYVRDENNQVVKENGVNKTESVALDVEKGSVTLNISKSADNTIFIKSLDNIEYGDEGDGVLVSTNIFIVDDEGNKTNAFLVRDDVLGGWYINSTAAVPEPATVAALFGLAAMGFALYRRRRQR